MDLLIQNKTPTLDPDRF